MTQAKFQVGTKVKVAPTAPEWAAKETSEGTVGLSWAEPREGKPSVNMYSVWFHGGVRLTIGEHDLEAS